MRKALFLSLIVALLAFGGIAFAADKIGTFGAPDSSGEYPMEVFDDRSIVINGSISTDGTISTATIVSDGAIYAGRATSNPCGTLVSGYVFFNNSTGVPCYCGNDGKDYSIYSATTRCF